MLHAHWCDWVWSLSRRVDLICPLMAARDSALWFLAPWGPTLEEAGRGLGGTCPLRRGARAQHAPGATGASAGGGPGAGRPAPALSRPRTWLPGGSGSAGASPLLLRAGGARLSPSVSGQAEAALLPDLGPLSSPQLVWSLLAPGAGCSPVWLVSGPHPSVGPTAGPARAGTWGSRCSPRCSGGAEWSS